MNYGATIDLIGDETVSQNENGYPVYLQSKRTVYADPTSVGRSEFYSAMQSGITITAAFTVAACDYQRERLLDFNGVRYKVERTYMLNQDRVQLNCSEVKRLDDESADN